MRILGRIRIQTALNIRIAYQDTTIRLALLKQLSHQAQLGFHHHCEHPLHQHSSVSVIMVYHPFDYLTAMHLQGVSLCRQSVIQLVHFEFSAALDLSSEP